VKKTMGGQLPLSPMPFIEGDFNACGWAGIGDASIYALNALKKLNPVVGMLVFVYADDGPGEIFGQVAVLEYITLDKFTGWRANPVKGMSYRGPKPHFLTG
jgi:hypothetical protein